MLVELVNSGIAVSKTESKGRHGYGSQFKLSVDPELIGNSCFPDWWPSVVESKKKKEAAAQASKRLKLLSSGRRSSSLGNLYRTLGF